MNTLEKRLTGGKKLIAFIVAGDPTLDESFETACEAIEAGADVLELGLPFSDPVADGKTIQEAGMRALNAGMNTDRYFELAKRVDERYDTPLVCLTYYNLALQYGLERFAKACAESGIDGLIIPDLPLEEAKPLLTHLRRNDVDLIFLVAETTPDKRLTRIMKAASGFIYIVALLGTTGARDELSPKLKGLIARVRKKTKLPLGVGFGISTPEHVRQVISFGADAAIVGSGIVRLVGEGRCVSEYIGALKDATR
ncbi:MAG: tryptophan synthase subunit alpha [Candidatus Altiarchaeota archaeon]